MNIEAKIEELGKAVADARKLNDDALAAGTKELSETKASLKAVNDEITKLQDQIKAVHAAHNRDTQAAAAAEGGTDEAKKLRKEMFRKFMSRGDERMTEQEIKAMSVGSDPDGGYLVPEEMSSEIVKKIFESSPMRQLASVQQIGTDELKILVDIDQAAVGWVSETGARTATSTPQLKEIKIPVHELYAFPFQTQKLLDDAMFNPEAWLAENVQGVLARAEATAFFSGDGIVKPRGILTYASGTSGFNDIEQVVSGSATTITADKLVSMNYSLKGGYKGNASWLMQRATEAEVRLLKDTTNQYLWQPSLQLGQPDLLMGRPIYEAADMQATGTLNNLVIAFGDFRAGYQIADRFGIRVLRDALTNKPYVGFYTTKRVGGGVKNFEAIKLMKIST